MDDQPISREQWLQNIKQLRDDHFAGFHGLDTYDYQREVSDQIIEEMVDNLLLIRDATPEDIEEMETLELPVEFSRQSGKTTTIVHTIEFIMLFFPEIFGQAIAIGLFAPQKEQAKTDFDRLKNLLLKSQKKLIVTEDSDEEKRTKEENNARTVAISNGASCFISPVTKQSKAESKTFHLMIFEEAQDIEDSIMTEDIFPMAASTNAPRVFVGTAGIRECYFKSLVENSPNALIYPWRRIAEDRRKLYEQTKNPFHLLYEQFVKNEIAKYPRGEEDDAIKRPYNLVWITETGMFVTKAKLLTCRIEKPYEEGNLEHDHFFGLDQAKHVDSMVLKIGRVIENRLTVVRSFEMQGVDYDDQTEAVLKILSGFKVKAGAIDSTGQGDYMPDVMKKRVSYTIYPVTFSQQSKDQMYKSFDAKLSTSQPDRGRFGFGYYWTEDNQSAQQFEAEMLELEKEYKGTNQYYLSVHHPNKPNAHDDHPDATALMIYAFDGYHKGSGIGDYYAEMRQGAEDQGKEKTPDYTGTIITNGLSR